MTRARGIPVTVKTPDGDITFTFEKKAVKNVNLRIRADGSVHVSAPHRTSFAFVEKFVREHGGWITARVQRAEDRARAAKRSFAEGGSLPLLGDEIAVEVRGGEKSRAAFDAETGVLAVTVSEKDGAEADALVRKWAERRAKEILPRIFRAAEAETGGKFGAPVQLCLRRMCARWGSCNVGARRITLNTRLIYAPEECVRYVCMHELAHLGHPRHDEGFYRELSLLCPEWKALRRRLNDEFAALLAD